MAEGRAHTTPTSSLCEHGRKPRLLDLFCGAGGAGTGYARAGFEIVGVDIRPQPNYPFKFYCDDATKFVSRYLHMGFDAIHASPPCEHYANVTAWRGNHDDHPDLVGITRELLSQTGLPWVIENVREAGLRDPLLLCGSMFGLRVKRHRHFEANWPLGQMAPFGCRHDGLLPFMHKGERAYADAMGCDWMSNREARKAIPPAYTEFIGAQLFPLVRQGVAA